MTGKTVSSALKTDDKQKNRRISGKNNDSMLFPYVKSICAAGVIELIID